MIFRLEYCNKASVTARVDIQKGDATPIYTVEGTAEPFVLFYNNDKGDKSGSFRSSGADINIYETTDFNIDELKTSNETEISVKYYINNILNWSGFVIPDFFSETITGGQGVVSMVASDRLGTLKGATLSGLTAKVSNRALAEDCLAQTGLSLPLYTMADFTGDGTNIFNSEVLSQRMVDTKGRNVSCYDILSSILEETNSLIVQRNGAWYIVNKLQLEAGVGSIYSAPATSSAWIDNTVSFDEVSVGARRTITPVAATVGVYHEHGGGRLHPDNYDFSQGVMGWTPVGGFVASTDNRQVLNYTIGGTGGALYSPVYGEETQANHLVNENAYVRNTNPIYLESAPIDIPYKGSGAIEVEIDVNGVGPAVYPNFAGAYLRVAVVAVSGTKVLTLAHGGQFVDMPSENPPIFEKEFDRSLVTTDIPAIAKGMKIKGTLEVADDLSTYEIKLRIYGGGSGRVIMYNSVSVVMRNSLEIPKGNIFKTTQGANYTKDHEIPTVLWGDYLTSGLNGYFYDYPIDDTSSLYRPTGELHSRWSAYGDPDTLPLLQHITRQKARMFSVAHDLLSADIATSTFDPLSIFVSCDNTSDSTRYVVVSARFDFLRSNVSVELEEVAYVENSKRDYIYSYFGEGDDTIKSIGGIAGGGGGGLTPGQIELIGGIKEKVDEVEERVNNSRVGVANLLRNTGFLGDFQSLTVDALTAVTGSTPIDTNPLVHWVHSDTSVIDAPSRSGKGIRIGSIQQNVKFKAGEPYVLSFWAKGTSLTVELVDTIEIPLTSEYKRYSFDVVASETKEYTFSLIDSGNTAEVYEIMLSNGNTKASYSYAEEDDLKAIAQLQAINVITDAIKNYDTDILGGLILTSIIQLGKYKDGVMERVNAGISGIYNNDNDPAVWAGGTMEMAIRTVQKFIANPNYQPTEEEWDDMAKIVFTHGGDGFFRGYIYALGGMFRGKVITGSGDSEIVLDPESSSVKYMRNGRLVGETFFTASGWVRTQYFEFWDSGKLKGIVSMDSLNGFSMHTFLEDGLTTDTMTSHFTNGQISNPNLLDLTDAQADELLASGEWYRTDRIVKVKP